MEDAPGLVIDPALLHAGDVELEDFTWRLCFPTAVGSDAAPALAAADAALAELAREGGERDGDVGAVEPRRFEGEVWVEVFVTTSSAARRMPS